jgi:hypothetical protein
VVVEIVGFEVPPLGILTPRLWDWGPGNLRFEPLLSDIWRQVGGPVVLTVRNPGTGGSWLVVLSLGGNSDCKVF